MKVRNSITLEVEKEERLYQMELPVNAPLGEAYEAVSEFRKEIVRLINESVQKEESSEDEKKEEESQSNA